MPVAPSFGATADRASHSGRDDDKALATIASMVGALVLARAVDDPKLSEDILRATKNRLSG